MITIADNCYRTKAIIENSAESDLLKAIKNGPRPIDVKTENSSSLI